MLKRHCQNLYPLVCYHSVIPLSSVSCNSNRPMHLIPLELPYHLWSLDNMWPKMYMQLLLLQTKTLPTVEVQHIKWVHACNQLNVSSVMKTASAPLAGWRSCDTHPVLWSCCGSGQRAIQIRKLQLSQNGPDGTSSIHGHCGAIYAAAQSS